MKLTVASSDLNKAMRRLAAIVERRNTIPVLANVRLEVRGDELRLTTTDLDIEATTSLTIEDSAAGDITVPAHLLADIVAKLPAGAVSLAMGDAARLILRSGRSRFTLATLPAIDFPDIAAGDLGPAFSLPAADALALFDWPGFAVSTEETRYYLNGVYMHVSTGDVGAVLRCVATDGHRLARIDAPLPEGAQGMPGVIVPRKTVNELKKLLDDDSAIIAVSVSETKVRFATPLITLTSKVIDGTFPDYTRVIPTGNTRRLEVDATEFAKAVDRVATVSSERSRAVKLSLDEDRLILSVNAPDSGAAEEELAVAYSDERLEIGFNAKYLLEIASQVDRENAVFLFNSSGDPTLMREGNDMSAVYVVMPMRV